MKLSKSVSFGLLVGALVSLLTTSVISAWEWLENPDGIFHGPGGTNWNFMFETAISWLIPTFAWVALIAFTCHLLVNGMRLFASTRSSDSAKPLSDGD